MLTLCCSKFYSEWEWVVLLLPFIGNCMGQVTIENLRTSGAGARTYLWDVEILGIPGFDDLNVRCTTVEQPKPNLGTIITPIRGFDFKEAGAIEWPEINFTVVETINYIFVDALWKWLKFCYDPKTGAQQKEYASPDTSGKMVAINLNDLNRGNKKTWSLKGCLLAGAPTFGELNNDKASMQNASFAVAYQYADM